MSTIIESSTMESKVDFLKHSFNGMIAATKGRTFMTHGRKYLDLEWFNASDIKEQKQLGFRKFLNWKFLNNNVSGSEDYIGNVVTDDRLSSFSEAIYQQVIWYKFKEPLTYNTIARMPDINKNEIFKSIAGIEANNADILNTSSEGDQDGTTAIYNYIDNRISAELKKLRPVVVRIPERPEVTIEGKAHCSFEETLEATILERQTFLSGPAGTGKTTLAEQIAKAMGLKFGFISCTAGMSEAHLLGRMNAHGEYIGTQFVDLFENGGLWLFDEVDAADANTMIIVNSSLANGLLSVPNRPEKPVARRHPDFICICAANTWGFGSNEYVGRNVLDAAFLDRFVMSKIEINYDVNLEADIAKEFPLFVEAIRVMRANAAANRIRRVISTRLAISGTRALMTGKSLKKVIERFTTGWTAEEKTKILTGVVFASQVTGSSAPATESDDDFN